LVDLAPKLPSRARNSKARIEAVRTRLVLDGIADGDSGVDQPDGSIPPLQGEAATKRAPTLVHY
jgi:hypothetical protein